MQYTSPTSLRCVAPLSLVKLDLRKRINYPTKFEIIVFNMKVPIFWLQISLENFSLGKLAQHTNRRVQFRAISVKCRI
jgi:hypothetical protein